jgi:predicted small lipoprotein YifL
MKKIILIGCLLLVAGCGQKGPLYIPEEAPTNQEEPENEESEQSNTLETVDGSF